MANPGGRKPWQGQPEQRYDIITGQPLGPRKDEEPQLVRQYRERNTTSSDPSGNAAQQHGSSNLPASTSGYSGYQGQQQSNIAPQEQTSGLPYHTPHGSGGSNMPPSSQNDRYHQMQSQEHLLRNAQASKQMVYEVYGNAITMLEELEHRELKLQGAHSMARSDIYLPNQSGYDAATIQRKLDAQLLLVQSQLVSCDRQIHEDVREELKVRTLDWASQRQARNLAPGLADKYAGKLFEVLESGRTDHPREFDTTPNMSERDMQRAMNAYMQGSQRRTDLDEGFRKDPNRLAVAPNIRGGAGTSLGAERILQVRPEMRHALEKYRHNIR